MIYFDQTQNQDFFEEPIRRLFDLFLQETNPDMWRKLHTIAAKAYDALAERYTNSSYVQFANEESKYHRQQAAS